MPMRAPVCLRCHRFIFRTDKKSGFGMLTWSNKDVYSGEWQNNKMWGYGCFRFRCVCIRIFE